MSRNDSLSPETAVARRVNQKTQYNLLVSQLETYGAQLILPIQALRDSGWLTDAAKLNAKYQADLVGAVCAHFNELSQFDRHNVSKAIEAERAELIEVGEIAKREGKKKEATYPDYISVFVTELGQIKRDIFTGDLHFRDKYTGLWVPALNEEDTLRGKVRDLSILGDLKYTGAAVPEHMSTLKWSSQPELIVEIPEWDRLDRITERCAVISLDESKGVSHEAFTKITTEWLANLFKKLADPTLESFKADEFILILTGGQGVGKDFWVKSLVCALGQWFSKFQILQNERDMYMQLHESLVLSISEFDRTAKVDTGTLKDIVTADHSKLRASHAKRSQYRYSHANFIATCNVADIFRDSTGSRRYASFEVRDIEWSYDIDKEWSLQLLAQAKHLAGENYKAPKECWNEVKKYASERTPEDSTENVLELWEELVEELSRNALPSEWLEIKQRGWLKNSETRDIFEKIRKITGIKDRQIRVTLSGAGLKARSSSDKGFKSKFLSNQNLGDQQERVTYSGASSEQSSIFSNDSNSKRVYMTDDSSSSREIEDDDHY